MAAAAAPAAAAVAEGRERGRAEGGGDAPSPPLPPPPRGQRADDTLDEVTRKELCTDTFCKVCGALLQFESQRIAHYEGKRHAQKVRLYLQIHGEQKEGPEANKQGNLQMESNADKNSYCKLCNMIFTSPVVAQSHYLGKIHTKKLKLLSDPSQQLKQSSQPEPGPSAIPTLSELSLEKTSQDGDTEDPSSSCATTADIDDPEKYCKLCSATFNNPLMARQHYVGKKHTRNEARTKLLAKMGTMPIPVEAKANAVGVGNYKCPICSINLTSIEMYQSHMQGNKHQIKESKIVGLMKKTYHSFQDELADYIKVQKARGLEPKTNFRKSEEEFENEEFEAINGHKKMFVSEQDQFSRDTYEPDQHSIFFSETCAYSFENQSSYQSPADRDSLKLESVPVSQCSTENCSEKQVSYLAIYKDCNYSPSPAESGQGYKPMSSGNNTNSYERSWKLPKTSKKEKECMREGKGSPRQQLVKQKRKRHSEEETDSGKDAEKKKKKTDEADSSSEEKLKHSKEKGSKEGSTEKESKKHKKEKKRVEANGPTEEEMLWNESILGF